MGSLVTIHRDHAQFFSLTRSRGLLFRDLWCYQVKCLMWWQSHWNRALCEIMQSRTRRRTTPVMCSSATNGNFTARREPDLSSFLRRGSSAVSERLAHALEKQGKGKNCLLSTDVWHLENMCIFTWSVRQDTHTFYHLAFGAWFRDFGNFSLTSGEFGSSPKAT